MIQARYRSDYPGEFVLLESRFVNGEKHEQREWIANPIENPTEVGVCLFLSWFWSVTFFKPF